LRVVQDNDVTQMLVYEDKLMGKCNLLAESQGTARVVPVGVHASVGVLSTNVHLKFDASVEPRVSKFMVEVSSDSFHHDIIKTSIPPSDRMATVPKLAPNTTYTTRVFAVYKDGIRAKSKNDTFSTPVRISPCNIEVKPEFPGSPKAKVSWDFEGATSDLSHFRVAIKTDDEGLSSQDVTANWNACIANGLLPGAKHYITVSAIYLDQIVTKDSMEFFHAGRDSPQEVRISQDVPGSNQATVHWSVPEHCKKVLLQFTVYVFEEDSQQVVDEHSTAATTRCQRINKLQSSTKYKVVVRAEYNDGIITESKMEHANCELQAAVIQSKQLIRLRNENSRSVYKVEWSYDSHETLLEVDHFRVIATTTPANEEREDNAEPVTVQTDVPNCRQAEIELEPGAAYSVSVITYFTHCGIERQKSQEDIQINVPGEEDGESVIA
jgi:hypothetical protein